MSKTAQLASSTRMQASMYPMSCMLVPLPAYLDVPTQRTLALHECLLIWSWRSKLDIKGVQGDVSLEGLVNSTGFRDLWDKEGKELPGAEIVMNGTYLSPSSFWNVGRMMLLYTLFPKGKKED